MKSTIERIKNLKQDLEVVLKKYVSMNEDSLRLKIKVLKDFKYVIDIELHSPKYFSACCYNYP